MANQGLSILPTGWLIGSEAPGDGHEKSLLAKSEPGLHWRAGSSWESTPKQPGSCLDEDLSSLQFSRFWPVKRILD